MSSSDSSVAEQVPVETIFKNVLSSSSEEPPMEEWSSLIIRTLPFCPKMALYNKGLYDPGSGEICGKYIPMSDSSVLRHPYFSYPGLIDPGIVEALTEPEPKKIYSYDGQELYLDLCKQMNVVPVRGFHRGLLKEVIDLRYYCVNPVGVRAMCLSMVNNIFVQRLDLTDNHLTDDACYHLGQLLGESYVLQELVLSGCRIEAEGMRRLVVLMSTRTLEVLDLSRNHIGDSGFFHLAVQLTRGAIIKRLNISYNGLTSESALAFTDAIEGNNTITHLDMSLNKMYSPKGSNDLLRMLGDSKVLTELNVAWNSLTTGVVLRKLLGVPTLQVLDLSNNRLSSAAAKAVVSRIHAAKKLHTLDLSHNPIGPDDAFALVAKMRDKAVKLKNLLMEDVAVTKEFVVECEDILRYSYRRSTTITYGRIVRDYTLSMPDLREIVIKRMEFITARATKKCKLDIALFFLEELKERPYIQPRELMRALKLASAPVDEGLMDEVANTFPGPKTDKGGAQINIAGVVEYIKRLWPDRRLPPTPPPEPEPVIEKKQKGKKKM